MRLSEDGFPTLHAFGDAVRVLYIDERCPRDRVYLLQERGTPDELKALLGDDKIGHRDDGMLDENKVQAIKAFAARLNGETLKPV